MGSKFADKSSSHHIIYTVIRPPVRIVDAEGDCFWYYLLMSWDENGLSPTTENTAQESLNSVVPTELIHTPRWLALLFKTIGVVSYLIAAAALLLLLAAKPALQALPWYFLLIPLSGFGLLVFVGYGLYRLMRWTGAFMVFGTLLGIGESLYSILVGSSGPGLVSLISLIPTICYIIIASIFFINRKYFSGEYFHPVFTSLALAFVLMLTITSWSSSKDFLNYLNNQRTAQNTQSFNNLSESMENGVASWPTYRSDEYGFEIQYPQSLPVALGVNLPSVKDETGNFRSRSNAYAINKTLTAKTLSLGIVFETKDPQFGWSDWSLSHQTDLGSTVIAGISGNLVSGYSYSYQHPNDPSFTTIQFVSDPFLKSGQETRFIVHLDWVPTDKLSDGTTLFRAITNTFSLIGETNAEPDAVPTPVPTSSTTQPSITILSPKGGESYPNNAVVNVSYYGVSVTNAVFAYLYNSVVGKSIYGKIKSTYSDKFTGNGTISIDLSSRLPSPGQYQIMVCDENTTNPNSDLGGPLCSKSGLITITSPTTSTQPYNTRK